MVLRLDKFLLEEFHGEADDFGALAGDGVVLALHHYEFGLVFTVVIEVLLAAAEGDDAVLFITGVA